MELNITKMMEDSDYMPMLSGSVFELGDNARTITWNNSKKYVEEHPLLTTEEQFEEARDYFKDFGAWEDSEIEAWSENDIQALTIQDIASQIREFDEFETVEEYEKASENGHVRGCIFYVEETKEYFIYIGN